MLPPPADAGTDPYAQLRPLEPLVWRHSWRARSELEALAESMNDAAASVRTARALLLAQALVYLNAPEAMDRALAEGFEAADNTVPAEMRLHLRLLQGIRTVQLGDYREAQARLEATAEEARAAGAKSLAVLGAAELGFALTLAGDHQRALLVLQEAHGEAVELRDDFLVAVVDEVFGTFYTYIDDSESALRHYRQALRGYQNLGYEVYQAEAIYGIASAQREAGAFDAALANFLRYRELTSRYGDLHGEFETAYGIASTLGEMGACDRALPAIQQAMALPGPEDYKAELLKHAAVCHATLGDGDAARDALQRAREIIAGIPELAGTRWDIDLLRAEAQMLAALGQYDEAYESLLHYHEQRIALLESNASERRVSQRDALENIRQSLQIELLQEQAQVRKLRLERQQQDLRSQRVASAFAVCAVLVAGGIVWWRLRDLRRLRELSIRDPLTGVANRRYVFERLDTLIAARAPENTQLSVMLLDVDDFKALNDSYGHPAGDAVLVELAGTLRNSLRPGDEVARIGGEEFLLLLPRTTAEGAQEVARRLLEHIRQLEVVRDGRELRFTVSLGIAAISPQHSTVHALYSAADQALYRAKAQGKNCWDVAPEAAPA